MYSSSSSSSSAAAAAAISTIIIVDGKESFVIEIRVTQKKLLMRQ
jgi:hypothetical protein